MTEYSEEIQELALKLFYADCMRFFKFSNQKVDYEKEKESYLNLAVMVKNEFDKRKNS